jgi:hypothetical protein
MVVCIRDATDSEHQGLAEALEQSASPLAEWRVSVSRSPVCALLSMGSRLCAKAMLAFLRTCTAETAEQRRSSSLTGVQQQREQN